MLKEQIKITLKKGFKLVNNPDEACFNDCKCTLL